MEIPTSNWPLPPLPIRCLALPRFILSREEVIIYSSVDCCEPCPVSHTFHGKAVKKRARKCFRRFLLPETPIPTGVSGEGNNSPVSSRKSFHGGWKDPWKETEAKPPTNVKTTYPSLGMPHFIKEIGDGWNIKSRCGKIFSIGMIHKVGTKKREPFSHDYRAQNMRILIDFLLPHEIPIYAFE